MSSGEAKKVCVACERGPDTIPLVALEYRGATFWICPQHLPFLIHDPGRLVGRLPGADTLSPSEYED